MKYYKDVNNEVYAYESDGSQDEFIAKDLVKINEDEALKIAQKLLTLEQHSVLVKQQKQELLREATEIIAPLQDAIDMGMATDKEIEQLALWKEYRVSVNRIDISNHQGIEWPARP